MADYLDQVIAYAELAAGQPAALVAARSALPLALCAPTEGLPERKTKSPGWSEAEEAFLAGSLGYLPEEEIARRLGRSQVAVHLRWKRDLRLPAPSKHPDFLTARKVADLMGIDVHKVAGWVDRGILPGKMLPGGRRIRRIRKTTLARWLARPESWVYFDHRRIGDDNLRRLVELAKARWGDEWWDLRQVADYHHADPKDVLRYVYRGELPAIHAPCQGGRTLEPGWARWYVRKSNAVQLVIRRGRGAGHEQPHNPEADAYLVLGRAVGLSMGALARRLGRNQRHGQVSYRLSQLHQSGDIPALIQRYNLPVVYNPATGDLFADWQDCLGRFPRLEQAMTRFHNWMGGTARKPGRQDLLLVAGVLRTWARNGENSEAAHWLGRSRVNADNLARAWWELTGLPLPAQSPPMGWQQLSMF